jgi:hypothetical protein
MLMTDAVIVFVPQLQASVTSSRDLTADLREQINYITVTEFLQLSVMLWIVL